MVQLVVDSVTKEFGGLVALSKVSFAVEGGEIKGLIGPNGAGKTTLFNVVTGFLSPTSGRILFHGTDLSTLQTHEIARLGIVRTFQHLQVFPDMTVLENVMVGRHIHSRCEFMSSILRLPGQRGEEKSLLKKSEEVLELAGLMGLANEIVANLPYGLQRRVEVARALAAEPKLLLLDEPAAGLNTNETLELATLLFKIKDRGVTVLLVEHDVGLVLKVCDSVVVLNYGQEIAEGTAEEIRDNPEVIAAYLGQEDDYA